MRVTTLLKRLLGIKHVVVEGFEAILGCLELTVKPSWRFHRCSNCGKICKGSYDHRRMRSWRYLDFGGVSVYLVYRLARVDCPSCGVVVEKVPWNRNVESRFTEDFEDQVVYHAQRTDKTTVTHLFHIGWRTVGRIMKRVAKRMGREDLLDGLERIAIDEISYRKHHHYLTLVADHDHRRIVWGKKGKDAETLAAFFEALGEQRCKIIRVVSMDMSKAYIKVVREKLPWAQIVFDRFHVEKLVNDALDKTRREEWQRLRRTDDEKIIKKMRWVLLKRPWDLDTDEWQRLSILQKRNARVYRAYLLKESFSNILDGRQPNVAKRKIQRWLSWACRSRLPEFVRVARTIREHLDDIVAYIRHRVTNGLIEGLNNKARLITRRAYGFHSAEATLAMIMLCCSGLELMPVHKVLDFDPHV